jgi:hypothetical protein
MCYPCCAGRLKSDDSWGASPVQAENCTLIKVLFKIQGFTLKNMMNLGDVQHQTDCIPLEVFQEGMRI